MDERLRIIPLGGVEEIGMNMTVFEYGDDLFVVDCGLMFPDEDMLGVDLLLPDYNYIVENEEKLRGIVITHGHEDHTGALPFLLRELSGNVRVFGTLLTLGLIREKIKEYRISNVELITVRPREVIELGSFAVEFIRVTHSIVDGVGLGITTPIGRIIHTGDFKLDPTPVDGELMDFNRFSYYGEAGTLLLLSDSTNSERGGFTYSEKEVRRAFEHIFTTAPGRIIIATFASNIHRIQQALDVAVHHGKKVVMCGRSIVSNTQIAIDLGYLKVQPETIVRLDRLDTIPKDKAVIITTGSQGEPMSVLSRIAIGQHKQIIIEKGDTIILSAKMIPGNERAIGRIINHLCQRGADVIYEKVSEVHVSGHASKEELKLMLNIIRPKYFVPIHGEYRQHTSHAKLALKQNIPEENIFILQNGDVLEITTSGVSMGKSVTSGRIFVDGKGFGDVNDIMLRDRRRLGADGIVIALIVMDKEHGWLLSGPDIISKGLLVENNQEAIIDEAKRILASDLIEMDPIEARDTSQVQTRITGVLKKYFRNSVGRRPMILPLVMEM